VRDELLHLCRGARIDLMHLVQITIENRTGWNAPGAGVAPIDTVADGGKIPHDQEVPQSLTALEPVLVEAGDRQGVRQVGLLDEGANVIEDRHNLSQRLGIDRQIRIQVDGARNPAHHQHRVRVLTAEDRMQLHRVALPGKGLGVVRERHQIGLGRQLLGRMNPVAVGKDPELPAIDEALELRLDVLEVPGRGVGPG
jgi:hypothetical protein